MSSPQPAQPLPRLPMRQHQRERLRCGHQRTRQCRPQSLLDRRAGVPRPCLHIQPPIRRYLAQGPQRIRRQCPQRRDLQNPAPLLRTHLRQCPQIRHLRLSITRRRMDQPALPSRIRLPSPPLKAKWRPALAGKPILRPKTSLIHGPTQCPRFRKGKQRPFPSHISPSHVFDISKVPPCAKNARPWSKSYGKIRQGRKIRRKIPTSGIMTRKSDVSRP